MRVIILGCGRTGAAIASSLAAESDRVLVIDKEIRHFDRLPPSMVDEGAIGVVHGDGTLSDVLRRAEVEDADLFIALTGHDTINAMAAQKAKQVYEVDQVIMRIRDPSLAELYTALGLNVYCPTEASVSHIIESISREG
ncbi:MAG: NAD-binding protein [Chloroflexi bacterium]|nr:NAD-binding protein [Chloroflexota bacterium]